MRKTLRSAHPGDPDLLAAFDRHLAGSDLASATRRGYRQDLEVFGRWLQAVRTAPSGRTLTAAELISYRDHLLARGAASATVNRILQSLRRWCRWAHGRGLLPEDPAAGLRLMRRAKSCRPAGLSEEEAQALLRAAGTSGHGLARRNYALVQVGLQAGLRVGELAALVVGDLTLHERSGLVRIRAGKGRSAREVPLNAAVRRALRRYLEERLEERPEAPLLPGDPVFVSERGQPMAIRSMQHTLSRLARRAGITRVPVSVHTLRHTFSLSYLRQNPGQLVELAALLGHDSLDTTALYTRPSLEDLAARLEGLLRES